MLIDLNSKEILMITQMLTRKKKGTNAAKNKRIDSDRLALRTKIQEQAGFSVHDDVSIKELIK